MYRYMFITLRIDCFHSILSILTYNTKPRLDNFFTTLTKYLRVLNSICMDNFALLYMYYNGKIEIVQVCVTKSQKEILRFQYDSSSVLDYKDISFGCCRTF